MANVESGLRPDRLALLNTLPCRPTEVAGRLADYHHCNASLSDGRVVNCLEGTNIPLFSDLSRDYPEPLLLHDTWGSGDCAKDFFQRVTLEPGLAHEIVKGVISLGSDFAAIHVRHTDFRTEDWRSFLRSIRGGLRGRTVLVCSDNAAVIEGARMILRDAQVHTVTEISRCDGRPLHVWTDADQATAIQVHRTALIDLLSLAAATDLYRTVDCQFRTSGFSRLAGALCEDRALWVSLLGEAASTISTIPGRVHHVVPWKTKALSLPRQMTRRFMHMARTAAKVFGLR